MTKAEELAHLEQAGREQSSRSEEATRLKDRIADLESQVEYHKGRAGRLQAKLDDFQEMFDGSTKALAMVVNRAGGSVTLTRSEIENQPRDFVVHAYDDAATGDYVIAVRRWKAAR